jgi:hypothetical protein
MKKTLAIAAAAILLTATAAFAQADSTAAPPAGNSMMMKGKAPNSDAAKMQAPDASSDAAPAKPKAHRRMAKNEAAMNASEAETTKQLNEQQAQMTKAP